MIGSYFWGRDFWGTQLSWSKALFGNQLPWDHHGRNFGFMLILVWSFLGWQALLFLYVVAFVIGGLFRFIRKWTNEIPLSIGHVSLLFTTLLLIVFWRQVVTW